MASECQVASTQAGFAAASIYPYTRKNSAHRQLAIDMCVYGWTIEGFSVFRDTTWGTELPQEFYMDVVLDMDKKIARGEKFSTFVALLAQRDASKYHEHGGKDGICYKKKYRDLF
jgi:hypothetical protein